MNLSNTDQKSRDSKKLSPSEVTDPAMERVAERVADVFATCCAKLKELRPEIEKIQGWFKDNNGKTLAGCHSFKEFCEKKLNRTEQAVYAMLGKYSDRPARKTKLSAEKSDRLELDYKSLLLELLEAVEKVGEKLPVTLTRKCQAVQEKLRLAKGSPKPATQPSAEKSKNNLQSQQTATQQQEDNCKITVGAGDTPATKCARQVINGLEILARKDGKFVVFDPIKTANNTVEICNELEQAIATAQAFVPSAQAIGQSAYES